MEAAAGQTSSQSVVVGFLKYRVVPPVFLSTSKDNKLG
jgi:hypothetical protein